MKRVFTPTKRKTILMLDDDQPAGQGYREKLQAQGFKVEITAAFDTTLQFLKNTAVDLAILDLCLPGINVVELIKNIRSDSGIPSKPIIAFSNPYLSTLTQEAVEAGATKSVAKVDTTPERLLELMRELGLSASPKVGGSSAVGALETNQEKPSSNLLINRSQILAKLRASYQNFTRTEREDLRRTALLQMHRQLRLLAGSDNVLSLRKIAQLSTALEALFVELYTEPAKTTASVVRTIGHSIETLASLFDRPANPQDEVIPSSKILVVDDEVIARQLICSAVGKAGLDALGMDDPLAAQRVLKRERFDLIFLDVEMPRLTGLELCVKIRAMKSNRSTPIVFVTSHSDFGSRAQSALSGGNDFIAKPFLLVEVALKALTWLFKDAAQPLPTASVQQRVAANAGGQEAQLAARHGGLELPRTSPVT
jgi:DNA-binding response OmpR family regulator